MGLGDLTFLDGYLFRVMVQTLRAEGTDPSGFYNYYRQRVEELGYALSPYDRMLCAYVAENFDPQSRRITHAATGLGTLPAALAFAGYSVAGVEYDERRFRSASRIRNAMAEVWPAAAARYALIEGEFPAALKGTSWLAPETVLIFTNCVATWPKGLAERLMAAVLACGDVILEARLFGQMRETPEERRQLIDQLEAAGLIATAIEASPSGNYFYHLRSAARQP